MAIKSTLKVAEPDCLYHR